MNSWISCAQLTDDLCDQLDRLRLSAADIDIAAHDIAH